MPNPNTQPGRWLVLLSAALLSVAMFTAWTWMAWITLVPFFAATIRLKGKQAFLSGALLGIATGLALLYWMVPVMARYTGGSTVYGIIGYAAGLLIFSLYFGLLSLTIARLRIPQGPAWSNAILAAAVWVAGEWLLGFVCSGMPWLCLHMGDLLLDDLYAIQPATWGGIYLLSFFVVGVNYLAALYFTSSQWKLLSLPAGILLVYYVGGYTMLRHFDNQPKTAPVTVAILCENTPPDIKWNKESGALLVGRLLEMNREAIKLQPGIALWTESAVPWTYSQEDDFVKEVLKITAPANITHIIGMNTAYEENVVYNSAYGLLSDGKVSGRYDKRFLLSLAEKPLSFFSLPFLGTDGFYAREGDNGYSLPTPYGKAGVLICNEATIPGAATEAASEGAVFLANLSNDGWFSDIPYLVRQHFFNARLRAVEVRKDIAINSNLGISGMISASGVVGYAQSGDQRIVAPVKIYPNPYLTWYARHKQLPVWIAGFIIALFIVIRLRPTKQPTNPL